MARPSRTADPASSARGPPSHRHLGNMGSLAGLVGLDAADCLGGSPADGPGVLALPSSCTIRTRPPPGMLPPQLAHRRLHPGRNLVRARIRATGTIGQRPQATLGIPARPSVNALPRHPKRAATSVTAIPDRTSRTARYRCSTTDTSTSANPSHHHHPATATTSDTMSRITAPVNHVVGPQCQASTGIRHVASRAAVRTFSTPSRAG
jgi:hypothetical protein